MHPALRHLIGQALTRGIEVEVYSNLVHITDAMWETLSQPGVRLATSFYSDNGAEHRRITGRNTMPRTQRNIAEALNRSIPLRVGMIGVLDDQRTAAATVVLRKLGVTIIGYDDLRHVGRGIRDTGAGMDQLCGNCGDRQVAVSPKGEVWPCGFSRWLPIDNVQEASLADILTSDAFAEVSNDLQEAFSIRAAKPCRPDPCSPGCSPSCNPQSNCRPAGNSAPSHLTKPDFYLRYALDRDTD